MDKKGTAGELYKAHGALINGVATDLDGDGKDDSVVLQEMGYDYQRIRDAISSAGRRRRNASERSAAADDHTANLAYLRLVSAAAFSSLYRRAIRSKGGDAWGTPPRGRGRMG